MEMQKKVGLGRNAKEAYSGIGECYRITTILSFCKQSHSGGFCKWGCVVRASLPGVLHR